MLKDLVKWFKFDVSDRLHALLFDALAATRGANVFFVQVGANDGSTRDPVRPYVEKYGWSGIAIEPVTILFDQLTANYANTETVTCIQALCSQTRSDVAFFEVDCTNRFESEQMSGLSSIYHHVIRGHFVSDAAFRDQVTERTVRSVLLDDILHEHEVKKIDLLVIDTEGADLDVLRGLDIQRYRPELVMLEHYHLTPSDRDALHWLMCDLGYHHVTGAMDSFFYRPNVFDFTLIHMLPAFHDAGLSWVWEDNHQVDNVVTTGSPEAAVCSPPSKAATGSGEAPWLSRRTAAALYHRLSHTSHALGDVAGALEAARQAFAAAPDVSIAGHFAALCILHGHLREAEIALDMALQLEPNSWSTHLYRSQLSMRCGAWEQAVNSAQRAVELAPANSEAVGHLQALLGLATASY